MPPIRPLLDTLEPRTLFAMTWSNQGPKDRFDAAFDANAATVDALVHSALDA